MEFNPSPPPLIGDAHVGDLYVDQATKSIWLIVDEAVNPSQAVLLCEIDALISAIETAEQDANTFTNAQVALKAPLVHTHTASEITDFDEAVEDAVGAIPGAGFVSGMIVMWSGLLTDIGVGALAGWALCDGSNGTPNLRDRFILGAGNKLPGALNSLSTIDTSVDGSHVHTNNGTVLTLAQLPSHTHPVSATGSGGGATDLNGGHQHQINFNDPAIRSGTDSGQGKFATGGSSADAASLPTMFTDLMAHHIHGVSVTVSVAGTAAAVGSNQSHTHGMTTSGSHSHTLTSPNVREVVPYYALAFIMKL